MWRVWPSIFLICRGEDPIIVYDRQGNFLRTWSKGDFSMRTHGVYVAPNGTIFATDDGNHTVRQFTPEGRLLMTMGTLNVPSDTGYDGKTTAKGALPRVMALGSPVSLSARELCAATDVPELAVGEKPQLAEAWLSVRTPGKRVLDWVAVRCP